MTRAPTRATPVRPTLSLWDKIGHKALISSTGRGAFSFGKTKENGERKSPATVSRVRRFVPADSLWSR